MANSILYKRLFLLPIAFLLIFCSCNRNDEVALQFIQADKLMETYPDSALMILQSIESPNKLNRENYANYLLLLTQAKDKNYLDISEDTLIHRAVNYFAKQDNPSKVALSYFYAGRVDSDQGKTTLAIEEYLEAKEFAEECGDNNLLGLIYCDLGLIYRNQSNFNKAIECYLIAKNYFEKSGNEKNAIYLGNFIGNIHLLKKEPQPDSALFHYNSVLTYAKERKDSTKMVETLRNIGVAYSQWGNHSRSQEYLKQALQLNVKNVNYIAIYRNLAHNYINLGQADSALIYAKKMALIAENTTQLNERFSYYHLIYQIDKILKKYESALDAYETAYAVLDSIQNTNDKERLEEIQGKYEKSRLQNQYDQAKIQQQSLWIIISIAIIAIMLMIWLLNKIYRAKNKMSGEIERTSRELESSFADRDQQANELKHYLANELEVLRRIISYKSKASEEDKKKFDQIIAIFRKNMSEYLDWNELYVLINKLHDGFVDKLQQNYPQMNESDLKMCCLIRAGLKNDEIALFMGYKRNSIDTKKSRLKEKMEFETMDIFKEFLHQI